MHSRAEFSVIAFCTFLSACGGGAVEQPTQTAEERPAERRTHHDGATITGLMGTISADAVREGLELHQDAFLQCFSNRLDDVDVLAGDIQLAFRIDLTGHVLWVYPKASTIGDRATEQCLVAAAAAAHFRHPNGGEAEFSYPISFDAQGDVRPAVTWSPDRIAPVLARHTGIATGCGVSGPVHVTAYVGTRGNVLCAGVQATSREENERLDCVVEAVRSWTMPTPGSYPAKVSFDVN